MPKNRRSTRRRRFQPADEPRTSGRRRRDFPDAGEETLGRRGRDRTGPRDPRDASHRRRDLAGRGPDGEDRRGEARHLREVGGPREAGGPREVGALREVGRQRDEKVASEAIRSLGEGRTFSDGGEHLRDADRLLDECLRSGASAGDDEGGRDGGGKDGENTPHDEDRRDDHSARHGEGRRRDVRRAGRLAARRDVGARATSRLRLLQLGAGQKAAGDNVDDSDGGVVRGARIVRFRAPDADEDRRRWAARDRIVQIRRRTGPGRSRRAGRWPVVGLDTDLAGPGVQAAARARAAAGARAVWISAAVESARATNAERSSEGEPLPADDGPDDDLGGEAG